MILIIIDLTKIDKSDSHELSVIESNFSPLFSVGIWGIKRKQLYFEL